MWSDVRFAVRSLLRAPAYALTAIVVMAMSLGLTTIVLAVVDGVLLRGLPYPHAEQLVVVAPGFRDVGRPSYMVAFYNYGASAVDVAEWQAAVPDAQFTGFRVQNWSEMGAGLNSDVAGVAQVQPNFFETIGVPPVSGGFESGDFDQESPLIRPVILMHETLMTRFGAGVDVIGRVVITDRATSRGFRVVGVMPKGFSFPSIYATVAFLAPFVQAPSARTDPSIRGVSEVVARLPPGMTPQVLRERLKPGIQAVASLFPPRGPKPEARSDAGWRREGPYDDMTVMPLSRSLQRRSGSLFVAVIVAAVLLLVLAAVNVSSLMTSRAWDRRRELETRRALGASGRSIGRLWVIEAGVILIAGAGLGLLAAAPLLHLIVGLLPEDVVLLKPAQLDWRVAALVGMVLVGLCALTVARPLKRSLAQGASDVAKGGTSARVRTPGRFVAISLQVAVAFVLTVVGASLVGSLLTVYGNDLPIRTDGVVVVDATLPSSPDNARFNRSSADQAVRARVILDEIRRRPGVRGATLVDGQVLNDGGWQTMFGPPVGVKRLSDVDTWGVTDGFYEILEPQLVAGRVPTSDELRADAPLIVVSKAVADAYWPEGNAIGQAMVDPRTQQPFSIVGVVREVHWFAWDTESPMIYGPYARLNRSSRLTFFVRTDGHTGMAIEEVLRGLSDASPLARPVRATSLNELFRDSVKLRRFQSWLFGGFAAAALIVVGVGILGLLAMSTASRTKEIGVRCALGATPGRVTTLILREQVPAVVAGLAVGAVVAIWAVGLVEGYLYQLSATDPRIWFTTVVLILATAGLGTLIPARRVSRIDPLTALRVE